MTNAAVKEQTAPDFNEPEITPEVGAEFGLNAEEFALMLDIVGRTPSFTELGIFSVMWSEHCSYKSSRLHLKKLPTEAKETLVVVRGFDHCLTAYPQHVWEETAQKLLRLPQTERKVRGFIRAMLSQAAEVKMDRQGRASVPRKLLAKADIDDQMVVIGALDKLEFWNPEDWNRFLEEADPAMEEVAESLEL